MISRRRLEVLKAELDKKSLSGALLRVHGAFEKGQELIVSVSKFIRNKTK